MKKLCLFPLLAALAVFVSCQKQPTEEERKAEVERQVQDRLASERADAEKQRLAQQQTELNAREKAIADREAAAASTPSEQPVESTVTTDITETRTENPSTAAYGMFYEKLDSEGDWRETDDYGYVWQPRVAAESRDWRPYTDGRWVYSDAGWTWISEEPFGWATYHYGRWARLRRVGWVWVPGNEWAPAWVSWRTSNDYVGWAPLPPEARFDHRQGIQNWADNYYDIGPEQYAFVPSSEFGAEHVRRAVIPTDRNITVIFETKNVTRITFANTTIVNEGPSYDELRTRGPRPIERFRLRRQRDAEIAPARVRGDELEVSAPRITEVREMPRPRRVREREADTSIENGWNGIADRSAVERARTKFRAEATPPPNAPPKRFVKPVETAASPTPPTAAAIMPPAPAATTPASAASPSARPTATIPVAASATPATAASPRRSFASPTPIPTPAIKPTVSATPMPAATATPPLSASPRVRPSPSIPSRPTPTPAPSVAAPAASPVITPAPAAPSVPPVTATSTPAVSVPPVNRVRPSPSIRPRPTPTPAPSVAAPPAASPAITPAPDAPSVPPATATSTPAISVPPLNRVRPSPTVPSRTAPVTTPAIKPPAAATPPEATLQPPRRVHPVATPVPNVPASTPSVPAPSLPTPTPVKRPSMLPPVPATTPANLPPSASAPTVPPSAPAISRAPMNDRANSRRPRPPGAETATPTPEPSTPPN